MEAGTEISELCRVEGINPTQYYSWKKQLIRGADSVFGKRLRLRWLSFRSHVLP